MGRIIINYGDEVTDEEAIKYVLAVIKNGRISRGGECYCYCNLFTDERVVISDLTAAGTDVFRILDD